MEPIVVEFEVKTSVEHAFATWTERSALWWPRSHTLSNSDELEIVFEPFVGGRIFEKGQDGDEYDWGEIVIWEPPRRIGYKWHLFFDRSEATDIDIIFTPTESGTAVRLHQTGFDRLPQDVGLRRRDRTEDAWGDVTGRFRSFLAAE